MSNFERRTTRDKKCWRRWREGLLIKILHLVCQGHPPRPSATVVCHGRGRRPWQMATIGICHWPSATLDGGRLGLGADRIGCLLPRATNGQIQGRTELAVYYLDGGWSRLGGGWSRLGGGRPIEGVVHLIPCHFHLLLTTLDVLQLLLTLVAPMGVLFVVTYTWFHSVHCSIQN